MDFDKVDLNGDGKISYAMFMGQLGNVEAIYRTQYGVEDARCSDYKKLASQNSRVLLMHPTPTKLSG